MAQAKKKSTSKKTPAKKKTRVAKKAAPVVVAAPVIPPKVSWRQKAQQRLERHSWYARLTKLSTSSRFGRLFALTSVIILAATVIFWTILSARLERLNADQLIDSYLFQNAKTFHDASFPGAHTFLIKWPLFALMHVLGNSTTTFVVMTVLLVAITITALVVLLYKIERRPLIFGTLCLALTSVLLLVPAQPAPGDLLPVNLAMIATRNLEYVVYLIGIYLLVRAPRIRSRQFYAAAMVAGLLIASDKLFAALYIGGALLAAAVYVLVDFKLNKEKIMAIRRWFLNGVAAFGLALIILKTITITGLTHIVNAGSNSPYAAVDSGKHAIEAVIFGIGAAFTNFGANPAHTTVVVRDIPHALLQSFTHLTILAYIVNLLIFGVAVWMSIKIMHRNLLLKDTLDAATKFVLILLWSTIAAFVVFIATNHYYPVDARYLTIELFAFLSAAALYLRSQLTIKSEHTVLVAIVIVLALPFGIWGAWHEYAQSRTVLAKQATISRAVASELGRYNIGTLIGDYWYVTPVKTYTKSSLTIVPMSNCTTPQTVLSSTVWWQAPKKQAVGYLLVLDSNQLTYGGCTPAQLVNYLGVPTTQVKLSGAPTQSDAVLWIYSDGIENVLKGSHKPVAHGINPESLVDAVAPALAPSSYCREPGVDTLINVVAHEDDDLLFMNPDLAQAIRAQECVTTVYLTAGDAGGGIGYWHNREFGAEAAYSYMAGVPNVWRQVYRTVNGHQISVEYLGKMPAITLISLNLPDGNERGEGFVVDKGESLTYLRNGTIKSVQSLDGKASYSQSDLIKTITALLNLYQPAEVHTQDYNPNQNDGDHSDHHATGNFTKQAYAAYTPTVPSILKAYAGYPGRFLPINVFGSAATDKQSAFLAYALYDPAVCQNATECQQSHTYGSYLTRQYYVVDGTRP